MSKGFFPESEAKTFEQRFFNFWPKYIDKRWFWLAFQTLENAGLTYYETDESEQNIRKRLVLMGVLYNEFCHVTAAHESENFDHWSEGITNEIKKNLSDRDNDELTKTRNALVGYFGNEYDVVNEMWITCIEGKTNCILSQRTRGLEFSEFSKEDVNKKDGEDWFIRGNFSLNGFQCMG